MKKNNNIFWIGMNSFFTDLSSEIIKPVLPLFMTMLWTPMFVITLFFNVSDFFSNLFKVYFWYISDKLWNYKRNMLIWYVISNLLKPFIRIGNIYIIFFIEFLNKIWKWIRTAPKEIIIKNSISEDKIWLWFWFQKSMDSLWAFIWTIIATIILLIFWYTIWVIQTMFILTIIPWIISAYIIHKKIKFDDKKVIKKTKNRFLLSFKDFSKIGDMFWSLMFLTLLVSIANIWIIFYIFSLMKFDIPYYIITLMYALYMLSDSIFWFLLWKLSDWKKMLIKNIFLWYFWLLLSTIFMLIISIQQELNWTIYLLWILSFISYWIFESIFDTWFKKLLILNTNEKYSWTVLWSYSWLSWITKILVWIPLAIIFTKGGWLIVYSICLITLLFSFLTFFSYITIWKLKY